MYSSTFSDWFCQAVIDFMLGNRTLSVFSEFLLKLQSSDPRDLIRLSKIRSEAIATSVARVLAEGERLLSGWTLFAPAELNTTMGEKFEEKVMLLVCASSASKLFSLDQTLGIDGYRPIYHCECCWRIRSSSSALTLKYSEIRLYPREGQDVYPRTSWRYNWDHQR